MKKILLPLLFLLYTCICLITANKSESRILFSQSDTLRKFLGNNIAIDSIPLDFAEYWDQVTPGNAGKWGEIAFVQDTAHWRWTHLDTIYNFSVKNNFPFKYHNLIWGRQQPQWIDSLDSANQVRMVETWIRQCGERYPLSDMVDVVNEPLHNPAPYRNALGGNGTTGWDWVIWSFEKARKYFPATTKLFVNEFDILKSTVYTHRLIEIINLLKDRDLIDGIGCQAHFLETTDTNIITHNLNLLKATGVPVYISEYDVNLQSDSAQLEVYKKQLPIFWKHAAIKGVTLWGYLEGQCWLPYTYLIRSDGTKRPAFDWLRNFVTSISLGDPLVPYKFQISQNYPNPFNPVTRFDITIPSQDKISIKIYDISGKLVRVLMNNEIRGAGVTTVLFDGAGLASGVYFYSVENSLGEVVAKKMILVR